MTYRWIIRGFCLALLVLAAGAWMASYWQACWLSYSATCDGHYVGIDAGLFEVAHGSADTPGWDWYQHDPGDVLRNYPNAPYHAGGFAYWPDQKTRIGEDGWEVMVPLWFPTTAAGLLLCLAWRKTCVQVPVGGFPVVPVGNA
jgi:hypothetical protein